MFQSHECGTQTVSWNIFFSNEEVTLIGPKALLGIIFHPEIPVTILH